MAFGSLWKYESAAGAVGNVRSSWPEETMVHRDPELATLIVTLHPKCPCSRATVDELAKVMAHCQGKLVTQVLVVRPKDAPEGWEKTDLWSSAAQIPGVTAIADVDGIESQRFGAMTSGQALLYSHDGRLLFAGGITESRGHSGDNAGRSLIVALVHRELRDSTTQPPRTAVYGCPLFATSPTGTGTCRK